VIHEKLHLRAFVGGELILPRAGDKRVLRYFPTGSGSRGGVRSAVRIQSMETVKKRAASGRTGAQQLIGKVLSFESIVGEKRCGSLPPSQAL
jgi:hypothetical protein